MRLIRFRLEELTKQRVVARHFADVELKLDVRRIGGLGIRVLPEPPNWHRTHRYMESGKRFAVNCIAYALDMPRSKLFCDTMIGDMRSFSARPRDLYPEIAEPLLDQHHWRRRKAKPRAGDLVVYCDGPLRRIRHMGVVLANGMVRSKWGGLPAIFEHKLWHVPLSYGTTVQYYHPMPRAKVEAVYSAFCL